MDPQLTTALAAEEMHKKHANLNSDGMIFLAGLCHDLGVHILRDRDPSAYLAISGFGYSGAPPVGAGKGGFRNRSR